MIIPEEILTIGELAVIEQRLSTSAEFDIDNWLKIVFKESGSLQEYKYDSKKAYFQLSVKSRKILLDKYQEVGWKYMTPPGNRSIYFSRNDS